MLMAPSSVRALLAFANLCPHGSNGAPVTPASRPADDEQHGWGDLAAQALLHRRRRATVGFVIAALPEERLRHPPEECADTMWAASTETLQLLRTVLGWSWPGVRAWLARTFEDVLLKPAS